MTLKGKIMLDVGLSSVCVVTHISDNVCKMIIISVTHFQGS